MSNLYRGSSIDASYQVSYHLAKRLQMKSCFRNWPIRNRTCLWQPYLLIDRDEMSNLYRGPPIDASYKIGQSKTRLLTDQNDISNRNRGLSIDASYQVSVHLAKHFFLNQPIRNKNRLWRPCLLMDRDEMSNEGLP
jgi:hypothetical protein